MSTSDVCRTLLPSARLTGYLGVLISTRIQALSSWLSYLSWVLVSSPDPTKQSIFVVKWPPYCWSHQCWDPKRIFLLEGFRFLPLVNSWQILTVAQVAERLIVTSVPNCLLCRTAREQQGPILLLSLLLNLFKIVNMVSGGAFHFYENLFVGFTTLRIENL